MQFNPDRIRYKSGYKYQLHETAIFRTRFRPSSPINTQFIGMDSNGILTIASGYAWDGASGPTIDDNVFIHISLIHDALYQLMRAGYLNSDQWRDADHELRRHCERRIKSAGWFSRSLWKARIRWVMAGLKIAGGSAADSDSRREVKEA